MLEKGLRENRQHGTDDFPLEYYQVDYTYPRYIMPHHCHDEIELIHIQKGAFRLSLNGKEYTLNEGDLCVEAFLQYLVINLTQGQYHACVTCLHNGKGIKQEAGYDNTDFQS